MAKIANVALTNTFDTWRTRSNESFDRLSQFAIDNSKLYANTITANVRFVSSGATRLGTTGSNRTIVNGLLSANGNLNVSGNTTLGGASKTLTIGGSGATVNATGWFGVTGRATVGTNLTVSGNTTFGGANKTSNTTGWFGVLGRASVSTNLHVAGNTSVISRLGVGTAAPAFKVEVVGGTNDGIHIKDAASATVYGGIFTQSSNFYVAARSNHSLSLGTSDTDRLTIGATGLVTTVRSHAVTQNLTVSGNTTFGAAGKTSNTTGWFGVNGRATVSTNLFVGGNTTLNGTTTDKSNALNQTLTDAATITWDTSLGRVATVTLGASRTIAAPTNQKVGTYILRVIQGGTGSYTLTWNGNYKWTAQTAPVLSTAVGAVDIITLFSDGTKMYGSYLPDVR